MEREMEGETKRYCCCSVLFLEERITRPRSISHWTAASSPQQLTHHQPNRHYWYQHLYTKHALYQDIISISLDSHLCFQYLHLFNKLTHHQANKHCYYEHLYTKVTNHQGIRHYQYYNYIPKVLLAKLIGIMSVRIISKRSHPKVYRHYDISI